MSQFQPLRRPSAAMGAALLGILGAASCASPQDVQYTREVAKDYERQVHDLERQNKELEMRYRDLETRYQRERRSGMSEGQVDASFTRRLEDLASMIDGIEGPVEDVERFDVEGGYILMIQDRILFDSGSAELGPEGTTALGNLAAEIAAVPHGQIVVRGHTDSDPVRKPSTLEKFPRGNLQLSAERAVSVAAYLISGNKVAATDVVVMGFGPHNPLRANDTAESKRMNRRVEIFVSDPEG